MTGLIFIRHSMPAIDPARPAREWELSAQGVAAAQAMAVRLAAVPVSAIVSSTETKARQTAAALAQPRGLHVQDDADLREHERAGVGFLERPQFEAGVANVFAHPGQRVFGEESADEVFDRFAAALERAGSQNPGTNVMLVTHGTALCIYLARIVGVDPVPFWQALTMPMAVQLDGVRLTIL